MEMKVYFHGYSHHKHTHNEVPKLGIAESEKEFFPSKKINRGATLLTFDPRTGFCDYIIFGKAYVVVESGDYPLSNHQVWGIQDLISEARDIYHCDPDHAQRGSKELLRWCQQYRKGVYGPLTIYIPRVVPFKEYSDDISTRAVVPEDQYRHRRQGAQRDHSDRSKAKTHFAGDGELQVPSPKKDSASLSVRIVVPEDHYRRRHRHRHHQVTKSDHSDGDKAKNSAAGGNDLILGDVSNSHHHSSGSTQAFRAQRRPQLFTASIRHGS